MMLPMQFMARMFLAAMLPLLAVLPALAFGFPGTTPPRPAPLVQEQDQERKRADVTITIRNGSFSPSTASIKPGQAIRWINRDDRDYSILSSDKPNDRKLPGLRSGIIKPGKSWTFKVPEDTRSGNYPYACKLRPRAKGTLRVD